MTHASRRSDYIVEQALGGGGMGTVYFAQHTMLDKQVDIKVLDPEVARKPGVTKRLHSGSRYSGQAEALGCNKQVVDYKMGVTPLRAVRIGSFTCTCLIALICVTVDTRAASLFGDFSCKDWGELEHSRKKTWANAFLAPLSLTIQGLKRAQQDPYNDDPNAVEPAIRSIDSFCLSHPQAGASDGAASYLSTLTRH